MAKYKVFKLHFLTPLHIGLGRSDYDSASSELHSDTLTSALAALKAQHGATANEISTFLDDLTLSSAFPYADGMYFLPKPLSADQIEVEGKDATEIRKKLKDVKYIDSETWRQFLVEGRIPIIKESQLHEKFITPADVLDFDTPYKLSERQRVAVSRSGEDDAAPFFFEWMYFNPDRDCGLYLLTGAEGQLLSEVEALLTELGETGIGTDKTVGGGQFTVSTDVLELPSAEEAAGETRLLSLSLYLPSSDESGLLDIARSCYGLMMRSGYMAGSVHEHLRHLWKKSVYMFSEGSVLSAKGVLSGNVVDLRPEWNTSEMHPVYRSGKALFVPLTKAES